MLANNYIVFDLPRSIDFQSEINISSDERAVAGKTSGLIDFNESVTWRGKHFGIQQELTSKVKEFYRPHFFADEMIKRPHEKFKALTLFYSYSRRNAYERYFNFQTPWGILGKLANKLFLEAYMIKFRKGCNKILKKYAESGKWREVLPGK